MREANNTPPPQAKKSQHVSTLGLKHLVFLPSIFLATFPPPWLFLLLRIVITTDPFIQDFFIIFLASHHNPALQLHYSLHCICLVYFFFLLLRLSLLAIYISLESPKFMSFLRLIEKKIIKKTFSFTVGSLLYILLCDFLPQHLNLCDELFAHFVLFSWHLLQKHLYALHSSKLISRLLR